MEAGPRKIVHPESRRRELRPIVMEADLEDGWAMHKYVNIWLPIYRLESQVNAERERAKKK